MKKDTSWNTAADWYNNVVEEEGSYQKEVILPNLLRLMKIKKGENILDLGCGTGFFARAFAEVGADVVGLDNSKDMVATATKSGKGIQYILGSADNLKQWKKSTFDSITIILALQNMERVDKVVSECNRILLPGGSLYIILNHPAFRVPKHSRWEWTADQKTQYRRIDRYLSEAKNKIQTHPGSAPENYTISFHRPLQTYFKLMGKNNLAVTRLEEWISHRQGPKGKTFVPLETARKEIPIFLFLQAVKLQK